MDFNTDGVSGENKEEKRLFGTGGSIQWLS